MPDRIPELDRLAAAAKEVPMLTATEVRRRGDRRRTVRRSGIAAVAVLATTAVGFSVWASPLMENFREPQWATTASPTPTGSDDPTVAPSETPSDTPSEAPEPTPTATDGPGTVAPPPLVPAPTWDNVPTLATVDWAEVTQHEGIGQAAKGLCDPGAYGGPSTILVRDFDYGQGAYVTAVVFGYASDEEATVGYDLLAEAAATCEDQLALVPLDYGRTSHDTQLPFDVAWSTVEQARADFYMASGTHPDQDSGLFNITQLVQTGSRVAWLTEVSEGQDYNCSVLPNDDAGQCMFPANLQEITEQLSSDLG